MKTQKYEYSMQYSQKIFKMRYLMTHFYDKRTRSPEDCDHVH